MANTKVTTLQENLYAVAEVRGSYRQGTTKQVIDHKIQLTVFKSNLEQPKQSMGITIPHDAAVELKKFLNEVLPE